MISLALLSEWKEVFLMKGTKNLVWASWQDFKNQQHLSAQLLSYSNLHSNNTWMASV